MPDLMHSTNSKTQFERTQAQTGNQSSQRQENSTASENLKPELSTPPKPQNDADAAKAVADLLNRGSEPEQQPEPEAEQLDVIAATDDMVEPEAEAEPAQLEAVGTLKELAEKTGLAIEALYDIEIVTAEGERATISEMKDAFSKRQEQQRENAEAQARRDEQETADIAQKSFLADLAARFGEVLTPEQRAEMQRQAVERDVRERDLLAATAPELSNPQTFIAFRDDAVKLMTRYGFTAAEMQVNDHRQILMMRDMLKMHKRLADIAKFKPKSKEPGKTKTSGKPASTNSDRRAIAAAAQGSEAEKVAAISRIMKG